MREQIEFWLPQYPRRQLCTWGCGFPRGASVRRRQLSFISRISRA